MTGHPLRLFVSPESLQEGRLTLRGEDAVRAYHRGARTGRVLTVLDNSGWEFTVLLDDARPDSCRGNVTGRRLASERRTKVTLCHGLLHPSDFRRLLARATALGIVSFAPLITDRSTIPHVAADGVVAGSAEWPKLVREAAERAGRGREPSVLPLTLFDQALDRARDSGAVLMLHSGGGGFGTALADRPFSIDVFCPPPGGFSSEERLRAVSRGATLVQQPTACGDPIEPALAAIDAVFRHLEA